MSLVNGPLIEQMLRELVPRGHHEDGRPPARADLGLGFVYYALARVLKPERVVAIGSYRGFAVVCFALGLEDDDRGSVDFVDAARVDDFWTHPGAVAAHFARFGVDKRVRLYQMTSREYASRTWGDHAGDGRSIDLLYIDGDHSFEGARFDYHALAPKVRDGGYIVLHDAWYATREMAVPDFLATLGDELGQMITLEHAVGLTIMKKVAPRPAAQRVDRQALRSLADEIARAESVDPRQARRLAGLVQRDVAQTAERERILESRLRFVTKANHDLRRILSVLALVRRLLRGPR